MSVSRREFLAGSVGLMSVANVVPAAQRDAVVQAQAPAGDLHYLTIRDAGSRLASKRMSPVELTQATLARIDQVEPKVRAFITLTRESAIAEARTAEAEIMAGRYRGPLHGIPVAVKDTHYTKGVKSTCASPVLADFVPSFDATIVDEIERRRGRSCSQDEPPEFSSGSSGNGPNNPSGTWRGRPVDRARAMRRSWRRHVLRGERR
jgi:Asp-tRNA(Asn)/Glu-tRNA(Gln) amidotransferase A subunit family amidase